MGFKKYWMVYVLCIVNLLFAARLIWLRTNAELGFRVITDQYTQSIASLVGIDEVKLSHKSPEEQAEFWLAEISRMDSSKFSSAVFAGQAWILDSPQNGFINDHLVSSKSSVDLNKEELDTEEIARESDKFELRCRTECLSKIKSAIEIAPNNPELRRMHALLLFQNRLFQTVLTPRSEQWREILDSCIKADPGNALYDYLAAIYLRSVSASIEFKDGDWFTRVIDETGYAESQARLQIGLSKPVLQFGTQVYDSILAFLDQTTIPRHQHQSIAVSPNISGRQQLLLLSLMRWQLSELAALKREGRIAEAIRSARKIENVSNQLTRENNFAELEFLKLTLRSTSLYNVLDVHKANPTDLDSSELNSTVENLNHVELDMKLYLEATRRMGENVAGNTAIERWWNRKIGPADNFLAVFTMTMSQCLFFTTAFLMLVSISVFFVFRSPVARFGVLVGTMGQIVIWCMAFSVSFVFLGAVPAELITLEMQNRLTVSALWIIFFAVSLSATYLLSRLGHIPWPQIVSLVSMWLLPILCLFVLPQEANFWLAIVQSIEPILAVFGILLFGFIVWLLLRTSLAFASSQFPSRQGKFVCLGLCFLLSLFIAYAADEIVILTTDLPCEPWIAAKTGQSQYGFQFQPQELRNALKFGRSNWGWAIVQWGLHQGPLVTPVLAFGMMFVWFLIVLSQKTGGGFWKILTSGKRQSLSLISMSIAFTFFVATLVFAIPYWLIAPHVFDESDKSYREHRTWFKNPDASWVKLVATKSAIQSDEALMNRFQSEVENKLKQFESE